MDNIRRLKGLEIAATVDIPRRDGFWIVPSSKGAGSYRVNFTELTCTCKDFEAYGEKCKHLWAVEFANTRTKSTLGVIAKKVPPRPTYPQNWKAYNAAQTNERPAFEKILWGLCSGIVEPKQEMGRPKFPYRDAVYCMAQKVFGRHSSRRTVPIWQDAFKMGYIREVPHYNTLSRMMDEPNVTFILKQLILESALPLRNIERNFAIDSSGFGSNTYSRWLDEKYGKPLTQSNWLKLHLICGAKSNIVAAAEVTMPQFHDNTQFDPLFRKVAREFEIEEFSADKAYLSRENVDKIETEGAKPFIMFKSNTTGEGPDSWKRMYHMFQYRKEEFLDHYHKRSNAESTMNMIKSKFGGSIRAKVWNAQVNEVLLKVLCHNIAVLNSAVYEIGLELPVQLRMQA